MARQCGDRKARGFGVDVLPGIRRPASSALPAPRTLTTETPVGTRRLYNQYDSLIDPTSRTAGLHPGPVARRDRPWAAEARPRLLLTASLTRVSRMPDAERDQQSSAAATERS
jgi:hypothetical protein